MWKTLGAAFVFVFCCDVWLPVLTNEADFGRRSFKAGHGFYDEREFDDGYAEYTGAEKKTFYEMQRRKVLQQQEDKREMETTDDWIRRELSRDDYALPEHRAEERRVETQLDAESFFPEDLTSQDIAREEELADSSPNRDAEFDEDEKALLENKGTAKDDLALKREEAKQAKKEKQSFDFLPRDGALFEGDMVMDQRLRSMVTGQFNKRDAINDDSYLWPGKRVPYILSEDIRNDDLKLSRVYDAIEAFEKYTCIRYEEKTENDDTHVNFMVNNSMCYSSVGMQGGQQNISIGNGCERMGTVFHEMMHTIGFIHEQSRPDRDEYVHVFQENIKKGLEHNFQKYDRDEVRTLAVNKNFYDYDSCLHYNNKAFSSNGEDTIRCKSDPNRRFGQRDGPSQHDIRQINALYDCPSKYQNEPLDDVPYE